MPYLVTEPFFSPELDREVKCGETVSLSTREAKAHRGQLRRTTQRKATVSRS